MGLGESGGLGVSPLLPGVSFVASVFQPWGLEFGFGIELVGRRFCRIYAETPKPPPTPKPQNPINP